LPDFGKFSSQIILGKFWRALKWKVLVFLMAIWNVGIITAWYILPVAVW
jgi:hypothetical protein